MRKAAVSNPAVNGPQATFREQSDAFRQRCRMGRWLYKNNGEPYVRPDGGGAKGKAAIKRAKRERVRLLKLAEAEEVNA